MATKKRFHIGSGPELRGLLAEAIIGVIEGRVSVQQANAIANLSSEIHKSIRTECEMAEIETGVVIENAQVMRLTNG